ncbi:MAG: aminotransferase class IV [Pseudomonadota bacterium]
MIQWINGQIYRGDGAVKVTDRGFTLGDSVFETIRIEAGVPLFWPRHMARLRRGLEKFKFAKSPSAEHLWSAAHSLIEDAGPTEYASLRLTVSRGVAPRGVAPPLQETASVVLTMAPAQGVTEKPQRSFIVYTDDKLPPRAAWGFKYPGFYPVHTMGGHAARLAGADDALIVNTDDQIVSSTCANVFMIQPDGTIVTPPLSAGPLPGTVRACLLEDERLEIREDEIGLESLSSGMICFSNSLLGIAKGALLMPSSQSGQPSKSAQVAQTRTSKQESQYEKMVSVFAELVKTELVRVGG